MNCQNCRNWAFGRCVVTNLSVGPDVLCNAWELSQSWEMVDMQFATFDAEELRKRILELEYNAANNAMSIHAIMTILDVDNKISETDDMYQTVHELAHKLRARIHELEAERDGYRALCKELESRLDLFYANTNNIIADENENLRDKIAELKKLVAQLVEVGNALVYPDGVFDDEQSEIELKWHGLVRDWKEVQE